MLLELADYSRYFALFIGALQVLEGIFRWSNYCGYEQLSTVYIVSNISNAYL